MVKKIILSAFDVAALVMLIICAVYGWTIAGLILLALVAVQYVAQTFVFVSSVGAIGLLSPLFAVIFGFGIAFPLFIVGMGLGISECFMILGAILAGFSVAYTFSSLVRR